MATLVLTTVGAIFGGPVGAAVGAVVGAELDSNVFFKPRAREGPRLAELKVQTSSYGTQIQQVFGRLRVGGCVIWSTDLIESRSTSGGGKGQPATNAYSYSASFAVALSGRPIRDIGRIWADGKLLRGAAGDFKVATGFRFHPGDERQAPDPLIASAEGIAMTPAHRGIGYAVFEQLQLADYGNRIPSLTFEVLADDGAVTIDAIAAAVSDGMVGGAVAQPLDGFAAAGDSVRGVLDTLALAGGAWFVPSGAKLVLRGGLAPDATIDDGAVRAGEAGQPRHGRSIAAIETVERTVTLAHYDPARDYQIGVQSARRPGPGARASRVEMPAAIAAAAAKTMAQAVLARAEAGRERRTVTLGWDALGVSPGACVAIRGVGGAWRVTGWSFEQGVLALECVRLAATTQATTASAGRVLAAPDLAIGTTVLAAFEALPGDDTVLAAPRLTVVAAGTSPGWRRAAVLYSTDGGAHWIAGGAAAAPGIVGTVVAASGAATPAIVDLANHVDVELLHGEMALAGADAAALDGGANLALVGDELVQFGAAEQTGPTRWRLSRLLRGRRATEAAIGTQLAGDRFVLVAGETALSIDVPLATLGTEIRVLASGPGDGAGPAEVRLTIAGRSVLPPAPVQLRVEEAGDGAAIVRWMRRSRTGARWIDGADAPLGEERELYRIAITRADGGVRLLESAELALTVARDERAGGAMVAVRQAGTHGESNAAMCAIAAWTA